MAFVANRTFDNGEFLLRSLGSLWSYWYPEHSELVGLMTARGEPFYQVYLDMLDLVADKSRFNIPIFKRQHWYLFTIRESQKNINHQLMNLYDTNGLEYQNANKPAYGDKENLKYHSFAISTEVKKIHAIYNRLINPSLIWMNNEDFVVNGDRGIISFYTDPFTDPLVPKKDVLDSNGNVVDQEIALWFSLSEWDIQNVYTQFGYALGIWMKSSEFYKEFISSIWDMLVVGPTQYTFKLAITALTGIPFAEGNETVLRVIDESPVYKHVETDKNLYTFKASATVIVAAGNVLQPGQAMTTAALIIEPTLGQDVSGYGFTGIAMSSALMNPTGIVGSIVFEDTEMQVRYIGLDPNNKAIVRFDVSGFPNDVEEFWQRTHREGLRLGVTMADALDTRAIKTTPTTPADLPETINPFQFALDHIFVNNLFLIYLRPRDFADGAPGVGGLDLLYPYLVAHTTYMIFVEIPTVTDYYNVGDAADTLSSFKGRSMYESYQSFATDLGCTLQVLPGRCR